MDRTSQRLHRLIDLFSRNFSPEMLRLPGQRSTLHAIFALFLAEDQVQGPAALGMPLLLAKMLRQLGVAGFEKGIVQSKGAVLAGVQRFGELRDGR